MLSCSDEDIEDGFDEVTYDNGCIQQPKSLHSKGKMTLSSFSEYCQTEVHGLGYKKNGPVQSWLKKEHCSDSFEESISDEDNIAGSENSLAYKCGTSRLVENYTSSNRYEGSQTSEWNHTLEECSVLDSQPEMPEMTGRQNVFIHSNSNQECPIRETKIKKDISCIEDKRTSANEEFDILEEVEEADIVPYSLAHYERKEGLHPSIAELLEGLQGNNCATSFLNSNAKATDREEKKRKLLNLGERTLENEEDPPEYRDGHASSDEEEINHDNLSLSPKQIEGQRQTMADLFQDAFHASNDTWPALPASNPSRSNYYRRLLQVMQLEKERHAKFSRFFHVLHSSSNKIDKSTAITVQIISRSLEGRLTVCNCLFQLPLDDKEQFERFIDGEAKKERTVIFNPKICENVDLVVENIIRIYPPWKEVLVNEESIILCTYYSNAA
ncbi:kinetochore protein [Rhynchospora pubera]|uniref:Kinetochore protein n=1 Tax=Rhynchospora pubera TaxID=906938 RepID=A0AAV8DUI7_9POAL|nr:kinetochore protein [Rhynchospora pubera]